jgi:hypothetical protein
MTAANATPDPERRRSDFESRMRSTRRLRLLLMAGGLILGFALIMNGQTLIGAVIGGLAVVRLLAVFGLGRGTGLGRRATHISSDASVQARQWLRGHARDEFAVAAARIGVPPSELRDTFQQGRSIAETATVHQVDVDAVIDAIAVDLATQLDGAVADGTVSAHDAHDIATITHQWATRLVHGHRDDFRQTPDS